MQLYWINWNFDLNERKFDQSVFNALNSVSDQLTQNEQRRNLEILNIEDKDTGNLTEAEKIAEAKPVVFKDTLIKASADRIYDAENAPTEFIDKVRKMELLYLKQLVEPEEIENRINLDFLHSKIYQELNNRGVDIDYDYGVYSANQEDFVIRNGHFIYVGAGEDLFSTQTSNNTSLNQTKYKVNLFRQDNISPGMLMVQFPRRTGLLWGQLWKTLLASLLFTGIILYCFGYTIKVIFKQKKLSEMKSDFINNMTHEFKTPIATISLASDSIASDMVSTDPKKVRRFANIIQQENKRMNNQVEKVLQMALIDKKDFQINLTSINIHHLLDQVTNLVELIVQKKDGTLNTAFNATDPIIMGDETHTQNIFHNLLDNAVKYSPDPPQITVLTRNGNDGLFVEIQDKGMGMSKEAKKHIFEKFFRVHTGNLHDVKGFGLGLSYVKTVMTGYGGTIDVKSELGKGSTFVLHFPKSVEK